VRLSLGHLVLGGVGIVVAIAAGCSSGDPAAPRNMTGDAEDAAAPVIPEALSIASPKANVRFLNADRLSKTFAKALALEEEELCKELGLYSCVGFIHKISLLGTDPYLFGVNDPLPATTTATPLVVERVATAGCVLRVKRDMVKESFAIDSVKTLKKPLFDRLVVTDAGTLKDVDGPDVTAAIDALYVRALQRHATAGEEEVLRQLYRDVAVVSPPTSAARDWAVASCVAVLTSMESIFY
jgi:hypothetical protein